jgi:hypothetical protein
MQGVPQQRRGMGCPVLDHCGGVERSEAEIFVNILSQFLENGEIFPKFILSVVVTWNSVDW